MKVAVEVGVEVVTVEVVLVEVVMVELNQSANLALLADFVVYSFLSYMLFN